MTLPIRTRSLLLILWSQFMVTTSWMLLPATAAAVPQGIMPFEWSMPDRLLENTAFDGYDARSPVPQYDPAALMVPADGWSVDFDACGVSGSTVVSYEWIIDEVATSIESSCRYTHRFPEEGVYQVALVVTDTAGDSTRLDETITVQDWLIVAVGDSYGSGEGNPLMPSTAQAQVNFSALFELSVDIQGDLQAALDQLPGLEAAQAAAQQLADDALTTLNQAGADLARVQQDLQGLLVIQSNVESDPVVTAARNNVTNARAEVTQKQARVATAQSAYDNCSFLNCATRLAALGLAKTALGTAQANLVLAEGALFIARNTAVVVYSIIASVQNFDALSLAINAANAAANLARNTYNAALNVYNSAAGALQQAATAVASLQGIIASLQRAWDDAKQDALVQYLDHLPVWMATAPSWGTPEPTYRDIVLHGALPGEALRCHRSMLSGQARAALALEQADPHTSVTLVHLSCSGATIEGGLTSTHNGPGPSSIMDPLLMPEINSSFTGFPDQPRLQSQLEVARDRIMGREVDAIVASIGGNDIGFSDLITKCITGQPCHYIADVALPDGFLEAQKQAISQICNPLDFINDLAGMNLLSASFPFTPECNSVYARTVDPSFEFGGKAAEEFSDRLPLLAGKWQDLDTKISEVFTTLDAGRVYLTEYLNPSGNADGSYCGWDPRQSVDQVLDNLPGVTVDEMAWADETVAPALRKATRDAVTKYHWNFVDETEVPGETIASLSRPHGYCADDHWVVRIPESLVSQQDHLGSVHPNRAGHDVYRQAIFKRLRADLYPDGPGQPPRAPRSARDSDGDGVPDQDDNCMLHTNPRQRDTDGDGLGNRCDADLNNDQRIDFADLAELKNVFFSTNEDADLNGDSRVDFADLAILKALFFGEPGPSCCNP